MFDNMQLRQPLTQNNLLVHFAIGILILLVVSIIMSIVHPIKQASFDIIASSVDNA